MQQPAESGAILFGQLAEMWRRDYVENPKIRLAEPTRIKYRSWLEYHILPRWRDVSLGQMRSKEILDWLHSECTSWYMMVDLRNILSAIFTKAQEWEILPDTFANPMRRVKIGRRSPKLVGMENQPDRDAVLIAAAILLLPKMHEFKEIRDTPALRSAVADAVRVAEFLAKHIDSRWSDRQESGTSINKA